MPRNLSQPPLPRHRAADIISSLERLNKRLNAGQVDTTTPEFYKLMSVAIKLQLSRLCEQLDLQRIDIRSGTFQDFLAALAKHETAKKPHETAKPSRR